MGNICNYLETLLNRTCPISRQIDIDFEVVARNPSGNEETFVDEASVELPSKYRIVLDLKGSGTAASDRNGDGKSSSGDEITFTLTVNNTGTADLTSVEVQAAEVEGLLCQQFAPSAIGEHYEKVLDLSFKGSWRSQF